VCREGRLVSSLVAERVPDVAILDLQIGSMGGMAVTMALRLDESAGTLDHVRVLMLLDRRADLHLARRSGAEAWMIKPLDPLRLKRAVRAVVDGGTYTEGLEPTVPTGPDRDHVIDDEAEVTAERASEADSAPTEEASPASR
jgi:DNA-binding NarL/FixJ family response regulator